MFVSRGKDISATVRPIGMKVRMVVELRPGCVFSRFGGDIVRGLQMRVKMVFLDNLSSAYCRRFVS